MVRAIYRGLADSCKVLASNVNSNQQTNMLDFQNATIKNVSLDQQTRDSLLSNNKTLASFFLPSSSPIKRLRKKPDSCNTEDVKAYDFSDIQCGFNSEKCKNFITKEVTQLCTVDKAIDGYLEKLSNDGVCDLGLEDVSYGIKSSPIRYLPVNETIGIKVAYFYTPTQTEAVIGIPKSESSITTRNILVTKIKEVWIQFQKGKLKIKVIILTPRNDASWLQRKISSVTFPNKSEYDYIVVRVRKSYTSNLKACLTNLFQ